jgi:hypothetical protein
MKAIYTGSYLLNQKRKREPGTVSETREAVPAKSPLWAGVSGRTQRVPINLHNQCVHWDFVPSRIGFPLNKLKFRLLYILAQDGLQSPPAPRAPTSNGWRFPPPGNRREGGAGKHFRRLTALAGRSRMEPFCLTADTSLRLICAKPCLPRVKREGESDADVSNSKGTDCSRSGSCWCAAFRAGLRAGAYPRHADRREGRNDQRPDRQGRNGIDQTLAFSW